MSKLIAKCGIDCGACPWGFNSRKDLTAEEFERFRNKAKRILGYMPIKTACVTCQTPDSEIPKGSKIPNRRCLIRQCVDKTGIANCAYCSRFSCDTLKTTAGLWNRQTIEAKLGAPLSEDDYQSFVKPFEGLDRLEILHASLKPEEIVEPARGPPSKTRIIDFPENLPYSKEDTESFKAVHTLITAINQSSFGQRDTDTFAQQHSLKNQKRHVLRFLWILSRYGEFSKGNSEHVTVDAKTFEANRGSEKTLAIWSFVRDSVFQVLSEFGVCCERVALKGVKEEDLTTGTGYMRSKGWIMKMSFAKEIGDTTTLKAIQTYTRRLDKKYGKKAFKPFSEADMRLLVSFHP